MRVDFKFLFLLALPTIAGAETVSECHAILADGKVNREANISQSVYRSAVAELFCSNSYADVGSEKGVSLAAIYEDITGSAAYSQEAHSELSNEICSGADRSTYSNARSVLLRQIVDKETVAAWRACVTRQTQLVCDIEAKSRDLFTLSVELPDGPYNINLVDTKLSLGSGVSLENGNLAIAEELVEGSTLFQTVRAEPDETGSVFFSGVLDGGERPTWSCEFNLPNRANTPETPPIEYAKLNRLLEAPSFAGYSNRSMAMQSPSQPHCSVKATESLSITHAAVNPSLTNLSISFECRRPDFQYNCGGDWASVPNDNFTGTVTAEISVVDNVITTGGLEAEAKTAETNCTGAVLSAVRQLNGRVLE